MDDYDWGVPYDPDMTVQEALNEGLIAVIDSGSIGRSYHQQCAYEGPYPVVDKEGMSEPGMIRCTRVKDHRGPHAYVVRWVKSAREQRADYEREQQMKRLIEERKQELEALDRLKQEATRAQQEAERQRIKETRKTETAVRRAEDRLWSSVYGPDVRKDQRFRDRGVGKVKGR